MTYQWAQYHRPVRDTVLTLIAGRDAVAQTHRAIGSVSECSPAATRELGVRVLVGLGGWGQPDFGDGDAADVDKKVTSRHVAPRGGRLGACS